VEFLPERPFKSFALRHLPATMPTLRRPGAGW